jgi:hypothetical protein
MKKPQLIDPSISIEPNLPIADIETGYCHMEKMANFDASAGLVRPVAIV